MLAPRLVSSTITVHQRLPKPHMCGESHTLWQQGGRAAPPSTRNPAQAGGPRGGSEPVGAPDSGDDTGFGMAPPRSFGSIKDGEAPPSGDVEWCFHAVCSCFSTPPTSRLDGPPPVPHLRPHDVDLVSCSKPPAPSLHPRPLDSALLHSSSSFGTRSPHVWL